MCHTYTIIFKCKHEQKYTHYCSSYLVIPRKKCAKLESLGPHYYVSCRKCQGQERDSFVVFWVPGENEVDSSKFDGEGRNWKKGEDTNYMLGVGHFDFVQNGDQRVMKGGFRVYQDGTEEAKREKKGLGNIPTDSPTTSMDRFDSESMDYSYQQSNESTHGINPDAPRAQSFPIKGKSKKPNVFGNLKKLITRPKSENDTAATGSFKGGKKAEEQDEYGLFPGSVDGRSFDDAMGYERTTAKEICDRHFKGMAAGPDAMEPMISNATSAPIDIPQNRHYKEADSKQLARGYINVIGPYPVDDEHETCNSENSHDFYGHARSDSNISERWSQYSHPSRPDRMSLETEISQPDEVMERISKSIDGNVVNINPHNIDDVLLALKRSFGTSSPSSLIHMPPRLHAFGHSGHSGHSNSIATLPIAINRPARLHALESKDLSASLPDTQGLGGRVVKAHWAQENGFGKVPSAPSAPSPLQQITNLSEPSPSRDIAKRNNHTTVESPIQGFALPKRSNTGDVPHPRHPLANEITRNNTLVNTPQTQARNRPILQAIQEPPQDIIFGPRYSSLPVSLSPSSKFVRSQQGRQSPLLLNRKGNPASESESRTNLSVQNQASSNIDRSSVMTTFSQFIPSRNEELDDEVTIGSVPINKPTKTSRRRMDSQNAQNPTLEYVIPKVPAIPAKQITDLPKIGRDASGKFSVEHIEQKQPDVVLPSDELPVNELSEEVPVDPYENHTRGTWDAVLRYRPSEVSPLSSAEDLNKLASPLRSLRGRRDDRRAWINDRYGDENGYLSTEPCQEDLDLISQPGYSSNISPPQFPSTFSPPHQVAAPAYPRPQPPPQAPLSFAHPQSPPTQTQFCQPHFPPRPQPFQHQSPTQPLQFQPHSLTQTDFQHTPYNLTITEATIPVIRPLQIRKNKNPHPQASISVAEQDSRAIHRRKDYMEEELRRADERLKSLRDGRGGMRF